MERKSGICKVRYPCIRIYDMIITMTLYLSAFLSGSSSVNLYFSLTMPQQTAGTRTQHPVVLFSRLVIDRTAKPIHHTSQAEHRGVSRTYAGHEGEAPPFPIIRKVGESQTSTPYLVCFQPPSKDLDMVASMTSIHLGLNHSLRPAFDGVRPALAIPASRHHA